MKAIILAAGVASRLRPLTNGTPKCLLKVGDKSILERTIDNIVLNGITDIIVVTGFLREMIENFLINNYPNLNFTFIYNTKYASTNNIYSLWMAKGDLLGHDILLLDSDIVFDSRILGQLINSDYDNCLSVRSDHELGEEEVKLLLNGDGSIKEISKVIDPKLSIGESMGIQKFDRKFVWSLFTIIDKKILDHKEVNIFYEAAFQEAIDNGSKIFPVDVEEFKCMEIDTVEDFEIGGELVKDLA
ncbi:MAG: phosphocholine cytidylyltransferase family protein [Bacteroidota bacterium]